MKQQRSRSVSSFVAGLQHVHRDAVDIVHKPRSDLGRQDRWIVRTDRARLWRRFCLEAAAQWATHAAGPGTSGDRPKQGGETENDLTPGED